MLSKYYNKTNTDSKLATKLNNSDTARWLNKRFARDTVSLSNRIDAIGNKIDAISSPHSHSLGESFAGGIIFYLDEDRIHGLIAARLDGNNGGNKTAFYSGKNTTANAIKQGLYGGKINTERMITKFGTGAAPAFILGNIKIDKYDDWYLPALDELKIMIDFNLSNSDLLGLGEQIYWSSSELNNLSAYHVNKNGTIGNSEKDVNYGIRAIRAF